MLLNTQIATAVKLLSSIHWWPGECTPFCQIWTWSWWSTFSWPPGLTPVMQYIRMRAISCKVFLLAQNAATHTSTQTMDSAWLWHYTVCQLPVKYWMKFNVLILIFKALHCIVPISLTDHLTLHNRHLALGLHLSVIMELSITLAAPLHLWMETKTLLIYNICINKVLR